MRAQLEHINHLNDNRSILCYEVVVPAFEFFWHYHPEYELTYITRGKGRRLVGDSIENFTDGDLVLLGPTLPHTWVSDKSKRESCRAIVIQFPADFIDPFLALPELKAVREVLKKAEYGIRFIKERNADFSEMVNEVYSAEGILSITSVLSFLDLLATQKMKLLASAKFQNIKSRLHEARMNKVLHYIQHNFKGHIRLYDAARLIHLSESAFCKYFKRAIGKTFSDYVNEIRIAHACSLLIETDKPVSTIAFESGFGNMAYFNRIFLKKKSKQPGKYRRL